MNIHFHLPYRTVYGEQIGIEYYEEKYKNPFSILLFQTFDGEHWSGKLEINQAHQLNYRYVVITEGRVSKSEWGKFRKINFEEQKNESLFFK